MVVVAAGPGGAHKVLLISSSSSSSSHSSDSCNVSAPTLRKRQRLTHLSPEEKALRRKLKNRVAAQTARDRKKAKMGELELQVLELEHENQKLHLENQMLRERTSDLMSENEELRQRLGLDTLVRKEKVQVQMLESDVGDLVLLNGSSESAALRLRVPPQQVQAQQSSKPKSSPWILTLLTLQTLSLISCLAFWTSLNQSCSSKKVRSQTPLSSFCWWARPQVRYLPPHLELWGPHQSSWRPLMN
ncbi:X-box-binding protein 1 [Tachysurus ichikawai]